jgi:hypothetical protein
MASRLKGNKLGNIFVNYHDPVRFNNSTNLVRQLDLDHKMMRPITLAKLLEFCVFSVSHQHHGRYGLISTNKLILQAKSLWNYIM